MAILSTASNTPNTVTAASLKLVKKDTAKPPKERKDHSKHTHHHHHQTEHLLARPQSTTVSILRDKLSQGTAVQSKGTLFRPRKRRKVGTVDDDDDDDDGSDGEIDPVNVDDTSNTLGTVIM